MLYLSIEIWSISGNSQKIKKMVVGGGGGDNNNNNENKTDIFVIRNENMKWKLKNK